MSVTYTIIADGYEDRQITIEPETTVGEAIKKINLCLGEDVENNNEESTKDKKKEKQKATKVKFVTSEDDQSDNQGNQKEEEPIEIFGLSAYTDRSEKFNSIKFPNNELIVYPIPLDNLFLKSIPRFDLDSK